ncbi:MAG: Ig-like domain-containing protein [bacterium]|nr:Ig-like domain-containing protein [bacterium]
MTLGPAPGTNNNVAEASAFYKGAPLGIPVTFLASATVGDANELAEVSGNYTSGVVGNQLETPFVVRVMDGAGNPVANHSVTFTVKEGGGRLDGSSSTTVTRNTGPSGLAQVYLTLGLNAGLNNNSVEVFSYKPGTSQHLVGSPLTFYASGLASPATQIKYVSGNGQPASPVRTALAQPFRVKVTDNHDNPVPDQPVIWSSIAGSGTFDNLIDTVKTKLTDQNGFAQVIYYPGPVAGVRNEVRARSWNGPELTGSPVTFFVDTRAAAVSATKSVVTSTSPVPADGSSQSTILVTLKDDYNNRIQGKALSMLVSGSNNSITPFTSLTDANGQATAYLASTRAEVKIIQIIDITDGITLQDTTRVRFLPLAASSISYVSGTNQISNYGTACQNPIRARVSDIHGNVIPNYPVYFEAYVGGGSIYEAQPALTDSNGFASAYWIMGTSGEVNRARATASGLSGSPVEYIATAREGVATTLEYINGNQQTGTAGYTLEDPLVVKVADNSGYPIASHVVTFSVDFGGGNFDGRSSLQLYTDVFGYANGYFTLGRVAGPNIATADASGLSGSPKRFTAMGVSGPAEKISKHEGDGANIQANATRWVKVKVTDIYDNAVAGYDVNFSVIDGDAQILSGYQTATSDPDGIAGSIIKAGLALGQIRVLSSAPGLIGDGLKFDLKTIARPAVTMEIYHGNNQEGTIGRELVYPLSVIVRDDYGNPAGGQNIPITFSLTGEKGVLLDPQPVYTNEKGIAATRLKLEDATGALYKVWAIKNGLQGSPLEFAATGVLNKFPLFDPIPDYTIDENKSISFTVRATDADGDPITYGLRNDPRGAQFDSLNTRQFSWTPDYTQSGKYVLNFMAWDNKGGFGDEPVTIDVLNVNRPPRIINYEPIAYKIVGHKSVGEVFRFMVQVVDDDNDEISYRWYNDDLLVSTKNYYDCDVKTQTLYTHIIRVEVSDGYDTVEKTWELYIKTPVELAHFSGKIVERKGVELEWETTTEINHAGFNLYRKAPGNQNYQKINKYLLAPDGSCKYYFLDSDIEVGHNYLYKLENISLTGERLMSESISVFVAKPEKYDLQQNYPNPFNSRTVIHYQLPEQSRVEIRIYNILGQEVKTLVDDIKQAGYHSVMWNGLDKYDNQVTSGVYYYRIVGNNFVQTRKMVFLK